MRAEYMLVGSPSESHLALRKNHRDGVPIDPLAVTP